jgi:hypothetical protein
MRSGGCDCRERCGRYRWREDWRPAREDGGGVTVDELPGGKGAFGCGTGEAEPLLLPK